MTKTEEIQQFVEPDGLVSYFKLDRNLPIPEAIQSEQLSEFDYKAYINQLIRFAHKHGYESQVLRTGDLKLFQALWEIGIKVGGDPADGVSILKKLYEFGCPPIYMFHLTGVETTISFTGDKVHTNPLSNPNNHKTWYSSSLLYKYIKPITQQPYIIAFPLLNIFKIDQRLGTVHTSIPQAGTVDLSDLTEDELIDLTSNLKVYMIKKQQNAV